MRLLTARAMGLAALLAASFFVVTPARAQSSSSFAGPFFGPMPRKDPNGIEAQIVALIGAAKTSVDVANYQWSSQPIIDALLAANRNGIAVRVVADSSQKTSGPFTSQLSQAGIPLVQRAGSSSGIMHCKYIVIDATWVWLGSANLTTGSSSNNCENGIVIGSTELAADFENDFTQMFTQQKFSQDKSVGSPYPSVSLVGPSGSSITADVYFAGEDAQQIYVTLTQMITSATSSIQIAAYELKSNKSGSSADFMTALLQAVSRGVTVQVICDDDSPVQQGINADAIAQLQQAGASVVTYHPNHGLFHDKFIIVDGTDVEMGSFNYTQAANDVNDEDLVVVHDSSFAVLYQQQFATLWQAAGGPGAAVVGTPSGAPAQPSQPAQPPATTTPPSGSQPPLKVVPVATPSAPVAPAAAPAPAAHSTPASQGSTTSSSTTTAASTASSAPAAGGSGGGGGGCALSGRNGSPSGSFAPLAALLAGLVLARRRSQKAA